MVAPEDGYAFWLWVLLGKGTLVRNWTLYLGSALPDELEAPAGLLRVAVGLSAARTELTVCVQLHIE